MITINWIDQKLFEFNEKIDYLKNKILKLREFLQDHNIFEEDKKYSINTPKNMYLREYYHILLILKEYQYLRLELIHERNRNYAIFKKKKNFN